MFKDGNTKDNSTTGSSDKAPAKTSIEPSWWNHAVVYRIRTKSFADADGDGKGDLHGIIDHLDYLSSLNIDGLQLVDNQMPTDDHHELSQLAHIEPSDDYYIRLKAALSDRRIKLIDKCTWPVINPFQPLTNLFAIDRLKDQIKKSQHFKHCLLAAESFSLPRLAAGYGSNEHISDVAMMFATILMTLKGTPVIYQGQELGLTMHPAELPWEEQNELESTLSVLDQDEYDNSVLNYYRRMINIRKSSLVLQDGDIRFIDDKRPVLSYLRAFGDQGDLIVANLTDREVDPTTPLVGRILISSNPKRVDFNDGKLAPYEVVVTKIEG